MAEVHIPPGLLATHPRPVDEHRLVAYDRRRRTMRFQAFADLGNVLPPTCLLVVNNSLPYPAQIPVPGGPPITVLNFAHGSLDDVWVSGQFRSMEAVPVTGGRFIPQLKHPAQADVWEGTIVSDDPELQQGTLAAYLERYGQAPVPAYLGQGRVDQDLDVSAIRNPFGRIPGSLTWPTAGLHFTRPLIEALQASGRRFAEITLHLGNGSWKTLDDLGTLDGETLVATPESLRAIAAARRDGVPVIAVGTSCVRALESLTGEIAAPPAYTEKQTSLFVQPGHRFAVVDGLLTDLAYPDTPVSTMTDALVGEEVRRSIYEAAVLREYRFDLFGDALLIM